MYTVLCVGVMHTVLFLQHPCRSQRLCSLVDGCRLDFILKKLRVVQPANVSTQTAPLTLLTQNYCADKHCARHNLMLNLCCFFKYDRMM